MEKETESFVEGKTKRSNLFEVRRWLREHWRQTWLLCWKNFILTRRSPKMLMFQLLTPIGICLYLTFVQMIVDSSLDYTKVDPPEFEIGQIAKCWGDGCATIGVSYSSGREEWATFVVDQLEAQHGLARGSDILEFDGLGPGGLGDYLWDNRNRTEVGVILCTGYMPLPANDFLPAVPCGSDELYVYSLMFNNTLVSSSLFTSPELSAPVNRNVLAVKLAIDQAILNYQQRQRGDAPTSLALTVQEYPHVKSRFFVGYDISAVAGGFYFFIPPMVGFVICLNEIAQEKEKRLRLGMMVMGLSSVSYWISWAFWGLLNALVMSNSLVLCARLFNFDAFTKTPYLILVTIFTLFSFAMTMLGFLVSTLVSSARTAYTVSYVFVLGGMVLQFMFGSPALTYLFHLSGFSIPIVDAIRAAFRLYPPFNFSQLYNNVSRKTCSYPDFVSMVYRQGKGFDWSDLWVPTTGRIMKLEYLVPCSIDFLQSLLVDLLIFAVLTWIADHLHPSNRGYVANLFGCCASAAHNQSAKSKTDSAGLSISGLHYTYRKRALCASAGDVKAVNDVSLECRENELIALLGHNGAGKSTLINVLTGTLQPTQGSVSVCGQDLVGNVDEVRKQLGYCPQHNILWDDLTAYEHLILFGKLRGISDGSIDAICEAKLEDVGLLPEKDVLVGHFSGGMKRRLSVILSFIGNPHIVYLDEPTTGMDPQCRRQVWRAIERYKRNKVVILTTHSMEEADVLSDRVVVMVDGQFKCIGTSLYLKNRYGDGYRITMISEQREAVKRAMRELVPDALLLDESGDSLLFSVKLDKTGEMVKFFKLMEGET